MAIKEQTTAGDALEKFKAAMTQLSAATKAAGAAAPAKAPTAPTTTQPVTPPGVTAPTTAPTRPGAKEPGTEKILGTTNKEIKVQDLARKAQELGIEPNKAVKLFQHYGIKLVR